LSLLIKYDKPLHIYLQEGVSEIFMKALERKAENKKLYTEDDLMQRIRKSQKKPIISVFNA
jgi:hypothetical protein